MPFNIASYALLTHMVSQVTGHIAGEFIHAVGGAHIYRNHMHQILEMLEHPVCPLPMLRLDPTVQEIDDFGMEHIELEGYRHGPRIQASVAV